MPASHQSDSDQIHWATNLIGKPWRKGANGPDAFYCWGLLVYVYRWRLNIKLPLYQNMDVCNAAIARGLIILETDPLLPWTRWFRVDSPDKLMEYDAVGMGPGKMEHVGIYTEADGGLIIHAAQHNGVIADKPETLRRKYSRLEFYRYSHG